MKTIDLKNFENTDKYMQAIKETLSTDTQLRLIFDRCLSAVGLKNILNAVPDFISALDLSDNQLYSLFSADHLKTAFQLLPTTLSTLDLSQNELTYSDYLKTPFEGLPTSLSTLNLSNNLLCYYSGNYLKTALEGLPTSLSTLNLSYNLLCDLSGNDLKTAFQLLPTTLSTLDLSNNKLYRFSSADLKTAFEGLSTSLSTLNLSDNQLCDLSGNKLKTAFEGLSTSLSTLDLSNNKLYKLSSADLKTAFEGLSTSLSTLDLRNNQLQEFTTAHFSNLKHLFDKRQNFTLTVSYDEVKAMDDERYAAFEHATKNISVDYVDKNGKNLTKTSHAEIRKAARLLAQAERATNKDKNILATLPPELHCLIAAHCRDTQVHSEGAAINIASDNFNKNVFKFPVPHIDTSSPRKLLKSLSDLVDYSMKLGGHTVSAKADNEEYGEPLLKDLKEVLKKMGNATVHPTIPYRPHIYLEAALNKIDTHLRYGLAKMYGNSNTTTNLIEVDLDIFKVRFCSLLNRLFESNIKYENYTAENSDQFVTDTLTAFRGWMTDGPIHNEKKLLEQHRIPIAENENQCRMM